MTQIILHIGTHKTGTTAIQRCIDSVSDDLWTKGVLYPVSGRPNGFPGHHQLAWSIRGIRGVTDEQCWRDLSVEIKAKSPQIVVLSSEDFEGCSSQQIHRIQQLLNQHSVKIVVYIRNHFSYLMSAYKETIKSGGFSLSFRKFVQQRTSRWDYASWLQEWEKVFGKENVDVRLFDKVKISPGLVDDFFRAAGINSDSIRIKTKKANVSPPDEVIVLVRLINGLKGKISFDRLNQWLDAWRKKLINNQHGVHKLSVIICGVLRQKLIDVNDVVWLREITEEWRQSFADKYVLPEDRHLFEF